MTPTGGRGPGSNTGPPSSAPVVASWPELLAATGAEDVDGLSTLVDDACEPDVWVADTDAGVEVGRRLGHLPRLSVRHRRLRDNRRRGPLSLSRPSRRVRRRGGGRAGRWRRRS